jgi:ABC-type multidrug transport system ATPase subunit
MLVILALIHRFIKSRFFKPKTLLNQVEACEKIENSVTENDNQNSREYLDIGELIGYRGVLGKLPTNSNIAILGPSGAGKTTLLNKLVNCEGLKDKTGHSRKMGLVPQFDSIIENLTVWDTLYHEVMLKQPLKMSKQDKLDQLEETIKNLNLTHILNNKIGNFENRGISGGERKRVSIGMELVGAPNLLFLDEPTTGLDSSSSDKICKLLEKMTKRGKVTTISTIHSPSFKSYAAFDTIALMGKGGHFIYAGPRSCILEYFEILGFSKSEDFSTSEYLVEIANNNTSSSIESLTIERLFIIWQAYYDHVNSISNLKAIDFNINFKLELSQLNRIVTDELATETSTLINYNWMWQNKEENSIKSASSIIDMAKTSIAYIVRIIDELIEFGPKLGEMMLGGKNSNFLFNRSQSISFEKYLQQFGLCFKRAYLENFSSFNSMAIECAIFIGMGVVMGGMAKGKVFTGPVPEQLCNLLPMPLIPRCKLPLENNTNHLGSFISYAISFLSTSSNSKTFGENQDNFRRELKAGLLPIAFFTSKFVIDLIRLAINCSLFTVTLLNFYNVEVSNIPYLFGIVVVSYFFGIASAYLISLLFSASLSKMVLIFNNVIWFKIFGGIMPALAKINTEYPGIVRLIWKLSVPRWTISSFYLMDTEWRMHLDPNLISIADLGYKLDTKLGGIVNSMLISLGWLFLAWSVMYIKTK